MLSSCKFLKFFLSSVPTFYSPYHHDPLICKNSNMKFLVLSYTSASLDNDMDHAHANYEFCTMVLLLERGLEPLLPSTAQKLDIHSYDLLLSHIAYTNQILFSLFPYYGLVEISYSSYPPSSPLLLDLSVDTSFLPVVGLLANPLLDFGTFVVSKDTSSVVTMSSEIDSYVAYQ
jgi:hypothetical protein